MNMMLWRFSLVLVLVCTFNAGAVEPVLPQNAYRMGANDVIRIQVFGEDDLTVETKVGGDGRINYPLLGVLQVGGQTITEILCQWRSEEARRVCIRERADRT